MMVNYVLPCSTKWANSELQRIYNVTSAKTRSCNLVLPKSVDRNALNITYGYLGWFSNSFFTNSSHSFEKNNPSTYILDHAYVPPDLKGLIFFLYIPPSSSADKWLA